MIFQIFKYNTKTMLRQKAIVFWNFFFPIILGSMFFAGFGHLLNGNDRAFTKIEIAVLDDMSKEEDEDALFKVSYVSEDEAISKLENDEVAGIIYVKETPSLTIKSSGINATITKTFLDTYAQQQKFFKSLSATNPEQIPAAVKNLSEEIQFTKEQKLSDESTNTYAQYFYALIAMNSLLASLLSLTSVTNCQANLSALGQRCEVSPIKKSNLIIGHYASCVLLAFASNMLLYVFINYVLNISFGSRYGYMILVCFTGSLIGVAMGMFFGSLGKLSYGTKNGILTSFSLLLSFLSGLMVNSMPTIIENSFPIINRVNPAVLITKSFFYLNAYDDLSKFFTCILTMIAIALILCILSIIMLRRTTYDNL